MGAKHVASLYNLCPSDAWACSRRESYQLEHPLEHKYEVKWIGQMLERISQSVSLNIDHKEGVLEIREVEKDGFVPCLFNWSA